MIRNSFTRLIITATLLLPVSVFAEPATTQSLSDLMSTDEMQSMGLDQLSEEQQMQLLHWILKRSDPSVHQGSPVPEIAAPASKVQGTDIMDSHELSGEAPSTATAAAQNQPATSSASTQDYETFGKSQPKPDEMRSRILGTFKGWSGTSRFELENGQVWQQRYKTTWRTSLENPEVVIRRHMLGLHRMEVVGTGKSVPVKRLK